MSKICAICGKPVEESKAVKCAICGTLMHRSCASDEALVDADENNLCPYDAMLAALDWFDAVLTVYVKSLTAEQRNDIIERLRSYISVLEGKETT